MRRAEPLLSIAAVSLLALPASAAAARFEVPAGPLGSVLAALGRQARVTIGLADAAAARLPSRGVRGRMAVGQALQRALAGTGYTSVAVAADTFRVVRVAAPQPKPSRARPDRTRVAPPAAGDIIVTGSKQALPLSRFAGTVRLIDMSPPEGPRGGSPGSALIVDRLPMISSTSLGSGRNKLYIRGVADSSFNGPSQSIVGQYLGEARLTFNAPDPDLRLYDIERIEVLEGPQGTLYGSGSLGGIVRLVPAQPDLRAIAGSVTAGVTALRHGGVGGDVAASINLPLITDRLAVRAVGYRAVDPGYIDDARRGSRDINRVDVRGGRLMMAFAPGGGWRLGLTLLSQSIDGRDGQYADRAQPPLTRRSALAQPFGATYRLANLTATQALGSLELVSTTTVVRHELESDFDATADAAEPRLFRENNGITMIAHETRLSGRTHNGGGWVGGLSIVRNTNRIDRLIGAPGALSTIGGTRNQVLEGALFGEWRLRIGRRLTASVGGRVTGFRSDGVPLGPGGDEDEVDRPHRSDARLLPTAALSWQAAGPMLIYVRYQQGFRAGGLAVGGAPDAPIATRFESDRLRMSELGARYDRGTGTGLAFDVALSRTTWQDIQADLIAPDGLPFTSNLGDGTILGLEGSGSWRSATGLEVSAAVFVNKADLSDPVTALARTRERDLPNVAAVGARLGVQKSFEAGQSTRVRLSGRLRYEGESQLAIGTPFNFDQGNYVRLDLGARVETGRFSIALDLTNAADVRGNRFAFGNPFGASQGQQITPLQPRTLRLGINAAF